MNVSVIARVFLILVLFTSCSKLPEDVSTDVNPLERPHVEVYKPDAEVVYADSLSLQALDEALASPDVKVVHNHTFGNGAEYRYMTIDGWVVDGDMLLMKVEELEAFINEYERVIDEYELAIANGEDPPSNYNYSDGFVAADEIELQGATAWTGCLPVVWDFIPPMPPCIERFRDWVDGKVYYEYPLSNDYTAYEKSRIMAAMDHISQSVGPSIEFIPLTNPQVGDDYIYFQKSSGCAAPIGRFPGANRIRLARECFLSAGEDDIGVAVHEILHALGMIHEHQRHDRDRFVLIQSGDDLNFFDKYLTERHTRYDYGSIMHYPAGPIGDPWSSIVMKREYDGEVGQRDALSPFDIIALQMHYGKYQ